MPDRVTKKICNPETKSKGPKIYGHEVFERIRKANKPKSVVPGHLPRKLVTVFCPELAGTICNIFNSIMDSSKQGTAKWPTN